MVNHDETAYVYMYIYHGGQRAEFSMSVLSNTNKPYIRRIEEGVRIVAGDQDILLNSREEFLQGAIPTSRVQRGFA